MQQPVLSIDVAKGKSVAAAFAAYGTVVRKPFAFPHTPDGLSSLLPLLNQLEEMTHQRPHVVLEATGHYSKPLVSFFASHDYPVVVLNPLLTHQLKKKATRKDKTDPIDAMRIAQAFYLEEVKPVFEASTAVTELQALCRQLYQWTALYTDVQLHFRAIQDLAFPGYDHSFQNIRNPTSLQLLQTFPSPEALLNADSLPEQRLLQSIPGVGPLTAATILSEIGDIKRFPSVKQLTAFVRAGFICLSVGNLQG